MHPPFPYALKWQPFMLGWRSPCFLRVLLRCIVTSTDSRALLCYFSVQTNQTEHFLFLGVHSSDKRLSSPFYRWGNKRKTSWPGSQAWVNKLSWVSVVPASNRRLLTLSTCSTLQLFYCCVCTATKKLRCKKQFWITTLFIRLKFSLFRASGVLLGVLSSY